MPILLRLALAALLLSLTARAEAATYYVSNSGGSDANSCATAQTIGTPKATIKAGVGCAVAGDTVYVREGTGAYTTASDVITSSAPGVASGSSFANAVTIAGYPGENVIIRTGEGVAQFLLNSGEQYVIVKDFVFDYVGDVSVQEAIYISGGAGHIRIQDVEVVNASQFGIVFASGSTGFNEVLTSQIHLTRDLLVTDITKGHGFYIICSDNLISGNLVWDNAGYGIQLYDSIGGDVSRNIVKNNRIYNNGTGHSSAYGIVTIRGSDNQIHDNLVYENQGGIWVGSTSSAAIVSNNTIANNVDEGLRYSTGPTAKNNIAYGNSTDIRDTCVADTGGACSPSATLSNNLTGAQITAATDFVDATLHNFRLTIGSAAKDTGTATCAWSPMDYDGVSRPQGSNCDVGAFEYQAVVPPASVPVLPRNIFRSR